MNEEQTLKAAGHDLRTAIRHLESAKQRFNEARRDAFVQELDVLIKDLKFTFYNYNIIMGNENEEMP